MGPNIWETSRAPKVLRKLRAKLEQAEQKGELSDPPSFAETQKLPYLEAVLKKGLCAHPAVGSGAQTLMTSGPSGGLRVQKTNSANAMFMLFGLGSRVCIGKNISLLEISKVIPQLVRKFDMEVHEGEDENGRLKSRCAWFVRQAQFSVTVKERVKS